MSVLHNPRHEQFAQLVASGKDLTQSFISAGYSKANAASCARRLSRKEQVRARIVELQAAGAQAVVTCVDMDKSWALLELGKIAENGKSESVKVRALELCGKELGMFANRSIEWDGDPSKITDQQLDKLIEYFEPRAFGGDPAKLEEAKRLLSEVGRK